MKIFDLGLETSLSSSGASTAIRKVARLNMIAKPASRSETLQKQLADAGARAFRVPFQESATHQDIVSRATNGIKSTASYVCLDKLNLMSIMRCWPRRYPKNPSYF
jgi:hypothetical protein